MKLYLGRIIAALLIISVIGSSCIAFADFDDIKSTYTHKDKIERLASMGIMHGSDNNEFRPDDSLVREEFAEIITKLLKAEEESESLQGVSHYSDVSSVRPTNGYINYAVNKGYLKSKLDGNFHPEEGITFAEICTVYVKLLGYGDSDITGVWPANYITKAKELDISKGISLNPSDSVPRWAAAVMTDNLLNVSIRAENIIFAEKYEHYSLCIILDNAAANDLLSENEVVTDKGSFLLDNEKMLLEIGKKYRLYIEDGIIKGYFGEQGSILNIGVSSFEGNTVKYVDKEKQKTLNLPNKLTYYHKGEKIAYRDITKLLQVCTSIVINYEKESKGNGYGVIVDPIYSKPVVASNLTASRSSIGDIALDKGIRITKEGKMISRHDIKENDVVYQVNDIWNQNKYIVVIENQVEGELESILPNKVSPKSVIINGTEYELSRYMDVNKINSSFGAIKAGDGVKALLGRDGSIVDIEFDTTGIEENFALVVDNYADKSEALGEVGEYNYYVKLLHVDGTTKTYRLYSGTFGFIGEFVRYYVIEDDLSEEFETVSLEKLTYSNAEYKIDKEKKKIDSSYVTDNVKIFNLVNKGYGDDCTAYLMDWEDMPGGTIPAGRIRYINKVGGFEDINVIFVENILNEDLRLGIVLSAEQMTNKTGITYNYRILIDGAQYNLSYTQVFTETSSLYSAISKGQVVQVKLIKDKVSSIEKIVTTNIEASSARAIDERRIRLGTTIYEFNKNVTIYFKGSDGEYYKKDSKDIEAGHTYGKITVYLDNSTQYDGKAEIIIVTPY
ncbi:MAG: S-layer homology domain-containing protein [Bacillota bacterium]